MSNQIIDLGSSKIKLHKLSASGWTKEFDNEIDLKEELYNHICDLCRVGKEEFNRFNPIDANSSIEDMLFTDCGCEFAVEYDDE